jgi:hypothetical protein
VSFGDGKICSVEKNLGFGMATLVLTLHNCIIFCVVDGQIKP